MKVKLCPDASMPAAALPATDAPRAAPATRLKRRVLTFFMMDSLRSLRRWSGRRCFGHLGDLRTAPGQICAINTSGIDVVNVERDLANLVLGRLRKQKK